MVNPGLRLGRTKLRQSLFARRRHLTTFRNKDSRPFILPLPDDLPDRLSSFDNDEQVIEKFRELVRTRLGDLAVAVFDVRITGGETKSLIGEPSLGSPRQHIIKKTVQQIKALGRQYAASLGDFGLLRSIDQVMEEEEATVKKRRATTLQRVGA